MAGLRRRATGIVIKNQQILLIHRRKEGREYWTLPGGGIEPGETPEAACIRELKEETNLTVTQIKYLCDQPFKYFDPEDVSEFRSHPFFLCQTDEAEVKLVGEEAEINCEANWYHPEWIDISTLDQLTVYPGNLAEILTQHVPA